MNATDASTNSRSKKSKAMRLSDRLPWQIVAVATWTFLTCALAGWWLVFGLSQMRRLSGLDESVHSELAQKNRMLISEGAVLFLLLFAGGFTLLYFVWRQYRSSREIREFFASFTHDLKTSLASLRLQAESLEEDLREASNFRLAQRLVRDTVRLELQLENSLFLASPETSGELFLQSLDFVAFVRRLSTQWPLLKIRFSGEGQVLADSRALESIIKNVIQNAVVHGKASEISFLLKLKSDKEIEIAIQDNGSGFQGSFKDLGKIFFRHTPASGSGIGLPLAMRLAQQMGGRLRAVVTGKNGEFQLNLLLKRVKSRSEEGLSG